MKEISATIRLAKPDKQTDRNKHMQADNHTQLHRKKATNLTDYKYNLCEF